MWIPLKGNDLGTRVYDYPEERPVGDLDILISRSDYTKARSALEKEGWSSFCEGELFDRFTSEEHHHWAATNSAHILLELHTRLWNLIPRGFEIELMEKAHPDTGLPPNGHRIPLTHAFVIAAVQAQINPAPRPLLNWLDLLQVTRRVNDSLTEEIIDLAHRWDLQLPVWLAASAAAKLWNDQVCQGILTASLTVSGFLSGWPRSGACDMARTLCHAEDSFWLGWLPFVLGVVV